MEKVNVKEMSYQTMKRHGENLKAHITKWKKPIYMILTMWNSGKGKTMETVPKSMA